MQRGYVHEPSGKHSSTLKLVSPGYLSSRIARWWCNWKPVPAVLSSPSMRACGFSPGTPAEKIITWRIPNGTA
ncbi:hypothetical protein BaRGS_00017237, partial [Batillaria attramentaria]